MKTWQLVAFGLLCGLLASGGITLISLPSRGITIDLPESPPEFGIDVDVSGAIAQPGVVLLPAGSRIEDAIAAAGGALPEAYLETLNLVAPLQNGSKVLVPQKPSSDPVTLNNQISADSEITSLVNINTADQKTMVSLPGIGESKANAIITYRTENGPFTSLEQIQEVSGIGPIIFENIKDLITI